MVPFFSFSGRIRRKDFWVNSLILGGCSTIIYFVLVMMMGVSILGAASSNGDGATAAAGLALGTIALMLLIMLPFMISSLSLAVRRWHDLNKSGLWVLVALVPFIGPLYALIMTGFVEGTAGPNGYGEDPKGAERHMAAV